MKLHNKTKGMTLLELTVVILVLLSLISILFIGARAWKNASDKAAAEAEAKKSEVVQSAEPITDTINGEVSAEPQKIIAVDSTAVAPAETSSTQ